MGLFDEEEYDHQEPQRAPERRPSAQREAFQQEFGVGSWSGRQVAVVAVLLAVVGVVFIVNFGTDPSSIGDRVKGQLGMTPDPLPGKVLKADSVDKVVIRYVENGETKTGTFSLIGLQAPKGCFGVQGARSVAEALPVGARVQVQFDAKLGRKGAGDTLAAYVNHGGRSVNRRLLEAGAAKLSSGGASQATFADDLRKANAVGKKRGAGLHSNPCR